MVGMAYCRACFSRVKCILLYQGKKEEVRIYGTVTDIIQKDEDKI